MLDAAMEQIDTEITGLRRLITDLRPAALDAFGVQAALEGLAERVAATSGLEIELDIDLAFEAGRAPQRHPPAIENALYRLVQEALTNVVKHADAASAQVTITEDTQGIDITVRDDGAGFDPDVAHEGFGLIGMRERALLAGGEVNLESSVGMGTTVHARIPVPAAGPHPAAHDTSD